MSAAQKVDVLAAIDSAIVMFNHDPLAIGHAEAMVNVRAAIAELIEATAFLSAELLRKYGGTGAVGEARVRVALASIGGAA